MARSGSQNRKRFRKASTSFTREEYEALEEKARKAGVSVSTLLRAAALGVKPEGGIRQPPVKEQYAVKMIAGIGRPSTDIRRYASVFNRAADDPRITAMQRDLSEMRYLCFKALGREP